MNLIDMVLDAQGGGAAGMLARRFGIGEGEARGAMQVLLPALARGLKNNSSTDQGLEGLLGALTGGGHQRYVDDPSALDEAGAVADGNAILGHVLGSKDVSRQVASRAAARTGLDTGLLKKMLPIVAALAMGSLSRHASRAGLQPGSAAARTPLGGLGSLLDIDGDGSFFDDIAGLATRFLR